MRVIEQGTTPGVSFNQSLRRRCQQVGRTEEDALAASDQPDELVLALRGIVLSRLGRGTTSRPAPARQ
jgi:hypothetical protein